MRSWRNTTRRGMVRTRSLAALSLAALAAALAVPAASLAEGSPEAATPEAGAEQPTMSIEFTQRAASVVGSRVLVKVRCVGPSDWGCVGTLAVRASGGAHKTPYSIEREEEQTLVVPLGPDGRAYGRRPSLRAVAQTVQPSGGLIATSRQLNVR